MSDLKKSWMNHFISSSAIISSSDKKMLRQKQSSISKSELSHLIQKTAFKKIVLIEPYDATDEKDLAVLLRSHKSDAVSIIIGITR